MSKSRSAVFVGAIVHYVVAEGPNVGHCRPAIVTRLRFPEDDKSDEADVPGVSLQVFTTGREDRLQGGVDGMSPVLDVRADDDATENQDAGTYHMPESCKGAFGHDNDEQGRPLHNKTEASAKREAKTKKSAATKKEP